MKTKNTIILTLMATLALAGCSSLGIGGGDSKKKRTPVLGERVAILSSELGIEPDPALAAIEVVLPEAVANDSWGQPGGNGSKSMGHVAVGAALGRAWSASISGSSKSERLASAPVVSGGKLFAVDVNGRAYGFDASTGGRLWTVQIGTPSKALKGAFFGGGASAEGDMVYVTNGYGDVEALNASTGARLWKARPSGPVRGAPALGNGHVYIMTQDSQLVALNQTDGSVAWTQSASLEITGVFGNSAPAMAQGTIVAGFSSGELNAYRYENGRPLWGDALSRTSMSTSVSSLSDIDANPVIDRGRVFAIGQGGRMVSMELVTGQRLWEMSLSGISTPWIAGEWLFVVDDEARLLCVQRTTGKVKWLSQLQRYRKFKEKNGKTVKAKDPVTWFGPVLAGNRLILSNSRGELVNVSPATGAVQSTTKGGDSISFAPIVANNTLYVLDDKGRISAWR